MTENEKRKFDDLKWWLVILTYISVIVYPVAVYTSILKITGGDFVLYDLIYLIGIPAFLFLSWRFKQGDKQLLSELSSVLLLFDTIFTLIYVFIFFFS